MARGLPESEVEIVIEADTSSLPAAQRALEQLADTATSSMEHAGSAAHRAAQSFDGFGASATHAGSSVAGLLSSLSGLRGILNTIAETVAKIATFDPQKLMGRIEGASTAFLGGGDALPGQAASPRIEINNQIALGTSRDEMTRGFQELQAKLLDQLQATQADLDAQQAHFHEASRQGR